MLARARHDAGDDDEVLLLFLLELGEVRGDDVAHACGDLLQRVLREIDPEQLLLPGEPVLALGLRRDVFLCAHEITLLLIWDCFDKRTSSFVARLGDNRATKGGDVAENMD